MESLVGRLVSRVYPIKGVGGPRDFGWEGGFWNIRYTVSSKASLLLNFRSYELIRYYDLEQTVIEV